ncbi:MAG: protein kinase [Thermoguttaceae bacterium]|jgi:serine/threonine protein kinase
MAEPSSTPGQVFGDYILLELLAESRTGKIFKAQHRAMGRLAALKLFSQQAEAMPQLLERFERKIKILARLSHPNLVAAQAAGEHAGTRYLAMEYVDGKDLASTVRQQGPPTVEEAVGYLLQAASGLGYAHAQGVYHRNVKPSNLMLDRQGVVKVVGFGLAHVEAGAPADREGAGVELTAQHQTLGSQSYIAPEQIGDAAHADQRADIYSLGCTLHMLLTGRPPYAGKSAMQQFLAHRGSPIPSLRAVRPDMPDALDAVFQKMLAKRPEDRYQSMDEVIGALRGALGMGKQPEDKTESGGKTGHEDKPELASTSAWPAGEAAGAPLAGPGGVVLEQYVLLEQLSSSRTGLVFKAQHRGMGRTVAVKFLAPEAAGSKTLVQRFHRAAKVLSQLEHRNLARALDAGEQDEAHYLVTEYVAGQDLRRKLQDQGPLGVAEAVRYVVQAAEGLDCVHEHGVCHRNVKPGNLLVDREGVVKLVGFTLAHVEADGPLTEAGVEAELTRHGEALGTYDFMSPEQALDAGSVDRRADIYSLGCTLYMLLTGHRPYSARSATQMILAHRTEPIPSLSAARRDVPEALDHIFHKMVAKRREDRYSSMSEVAADLDAWLKVAESAAGGPGATAAVGAGIGPARQATGRRKWLAAAGAALGALAILALAAIVFHPGQDPLRKVEGSGEGQAKEEHSQPGPIAPPAPEPKSPGPAAPKDKPKGEPRAVVVAEPRPAPPPREPAVPPEPAKVPEPAKFVKPADVIKPAEIAKPAQPEGPADVSAEQSKRLAQLESLESRYAEALTPAETLVSAWAFAQALEDMAKVRLEDKENAARLAGRIAEVKYLAGLKEKVIAKLNSGNLRLKKSDLLLRRINGEVTGAGAEGITAELSGGKTEVHAWGELSDDARQKLGQLVAEGAGRDDWIALGLLALGRQDGPAAASCFEKAAGLGGDVAPYLESIARMGFAQAMDLLKRKDFGKAIVALDRLESTSGRTFWAKSHRLEIETARRQARWEMSEAGAERLYAQAAALYRDEDLYLLRPIIQRLKADYPDSRPIRDPRRSPSVAEMATAAANLPPLVTIAKSGRGDFSTIQAAVDEAHPNSVLEILDLGPYEEQILIPERAAGLTIRGKKGLWPIVTSRDWGHSVIDVAGKGITLDRLAIVCQHSGKSTNPSCVWHGSSAPVCFRRCILQGGKNVFDCEAAVQQSVFAGPCVIKKPVAVRNSIYLGNADDGLCVDSPSRFENTLVRSLLKVKKAASFKSCTIVGPASIQMDRRGTELQDSIVIFGIDAWTEDVRIDRCNVLGKTSGLARYGLGYTAVEPRFVNPAVLDYHLKLDSPCRGKASDGGDLGFRFSPETWDLLQRAIELRTRGRLAF